MQRFSRHVLYLLACTGALIACSCTSPRTSELQRFAFDRPEMGVPFRIVLYAPDETAAKTAADAAFDRIAALNGIMSDYEPESELNRLSRTAGSGKAVPLTPDLWRVLSAAQSISTRSSGAFDVTVGPAVSLWRQARRRHELPKPEKVVAAEKAVGFQNLKLDPKNHTAELLVPGMRLDLGGIAKGYAIDDAIKVLRSKGITAALVSGGGDMFALGAPPQKNGWRIELPPLENGHGSSEFVLLRNRALATSGDLFQFVEIEGKRYSHIVDPQTGIGLTDHSMVVVIASNSTTADALSTAVSVLGPAKGIGLIEKTPGAATRIARKPGEEVQTIESRGFCRYYDQQP